MLIKSFFWYAVSHAVVGQSMHNALIALQKQYEWFAALLLHAHCLWMRVYQLSVEFV